MEKESTATRPMRDDQLNEALPTREGDELEELTIENRRLARIQEYEEDALSRPDPFASIIGMGNAHLQRIFEHFGAAILEEMDSRPHSFEECREMSPEIRLLVKLRETMETDLALIPSAGEQQALARPRRIDRKGIDSNSSTSHRKLVSGRWQANI